MYLLQFRLYVVVWGSDDLLLSYMDLFSFCCQQNDNIISFKI